MKEPSVQIAGAILELLGESEEHALNRFDDDGALPQGEVDTSRLGILRAMESGFFF